MNSGINVLDIEASGFGPLSYPIEIGLVSNTGNRYCTLIKPHFDWNDWSQEAEGVHGISRDQLVNHGVDIVEVASQLNKLLKGQTVYSDGWVVDDPWLIRLFDKANVNREFYFYDISTTLSEYELEQWHRIKHYVIMDLRLMRHRASNDALVIQETYNRIKNNNMAESIV